MSDNRQQIISKRGYSGNINGDLFSLKIASYPVAVEHLAKRLSGHGTVLCELCCGVGVGLIEFSKYFDRVIGVDNDALIIEYAQKNVTQSNSCNCDLLLADVTDFSQLKQITSDIVIYDIPYWSDYDDKEKSDNPDLATLVKNINNTITNEIVVYAPPHMKASEFDNVFDVYELEEIWINGRHDRNIVYTGTLIENIGGKKTELAI